MKIAVATMSFLPRVGGAEMFVHNLAQSWTTQGHQVCVINTVSDEPTHPEARYTARRYRLHRGAVRYGHHRFPFLQRSTRQIKGFLNEFEPDFISGHFEYPMASWLSHIKPSVPFFVTCHGTVINERPEHSVQRYGRREVIVEAMNRCTAIVAMSSHTRRVLQRIGVKAPRILDIPIGVELERFQKPAAGFQLREAFGLADDAQIVISVGRAAWEKAHDDGIQAFGNVANEIPQAHYVIVGKGTDRWASRVRELGLEKRVFLHDGLYGDELVAALQQSDLFLFPSVQELSPMAVVEALACGLPAVVTNISGSQDMVEDGTNGRVVEPGDHVAMGQALSELLNDPALLERMGRNSLIRAQHYDLHRVSRQYVEEAERAKLGRGSTGQLRCPV